MLKRSLIAAAIVLATASIVMAQSRFNGDAITGTSKSTNAGKSRVEG
jgi:hypothetical protein